MKTRRKRTRSRLGYLSYVRGYVTFALGGVARLVEHGTAAYRRFCMSMISVVFNEVASRPDCE
jgi:hypothetical protein